MSVLVVVRKGNTAVIASDSQFSQGSIVVSSKHRANHRKIYRCGDTWIGFTGWSLILNIFEDIIQKHSKELDFSSRKRIFQTFLFLHKKIKEDYFVESKEKDDQPVESSQWDCLIASPGGIFEVDSYRTVVEYNRYWANGSGTRFALGAMHALYDNLQDPGAIARAGIAAACDLDDGCGPPIQVHSVTLKTPGKIKPPAKKPRQ